MARVGHDASKGMMRRGGIAALVALGLCRMAAAEPMGSPSSFLRKGQWVLGLDANSVLERNVEVSTGGDGQASIYGGGHYRGFGLTDWLTLYAKVGGAYIEVKDASATNGFGGNLVLSGQARLKLWEGPKKAWQWNGAFGYTFLGSPHNRRRNQAEWNEWMGATTVARSFGRVSPYAGVKVSLVNVKFKVRKEGEIVRSGTYKGDGVVGPLLGADVILGGERDTVVNVETSYVGGVEASLALTKRF